MNKRTTQKLIAALQKAGRALSPAEAAAAAGEPDPVRFSGLTEELAQQGALLITRTGNLILPEAAGLKKAVLISQSLHFCFARPEDGSPDIYIDEAQQKDALIGDTVWVGNLSQRPKGLAGEVIRVLSAAPHRVTGRIIRGFSGLPELQCDGAVRFSVRMARGTGDLPVGEKILAELCRTSDGRFCAELIEAYGDSSSAHVCADAILDASAIPTVFPPEVLRTAEYLGSTPIPPEEYAARLDLRDEPIFTIDGADAKDLDDAISVHRKKDGWLLGVHIADVSHYVTNGSDIDKEARRRGTSVYFADRVVPMLPEAISNGVCSLNAGTDKLTFSALIRLNTSGEIVSFEFHKSVIHSKVRGVYAEVNQLFDGTADAALKEKYAPVRVSLREARKLAVVLKQRAAERGYMALDSTESRFVLDEHGVCVDMSARTSGEAEQLIEQLMITANQAAAKLAREAKLPFVYRVHEQPSPERLQTLQELAVRMGFPAQELTPEVTPKQLSALLEQARATKYFRVVSFQMLRTMAKARYAVDPIGHYGLALADYCHFTSPIRRYADTSIHRILTDYVSGVSSATIKRRYHAFAEEAAALSSDTEVRAMMAERAAEDCYSAECMRAHIGECFTGTISGVTEWGIYIQLENTAEGFIRAESLPDGLKYDGALSYRSLGLHQGLTLTVGDSYAIRVVRADVAVGQIDFEPADKPAAPEPAAPHTFSDKPTGKGRPERKPDGLSGHTKHSGGKRSGSGSSSDGGKRSGSAHSKPRGKSRHRH